MVGTVGVEHVCTNAEWSYENEEGLMQLELSKESVREVKPIYIFRDEMEIKIKRQTRIHIRNNDTGMRKAKHRYKQEMRA